MGIRFEWSRNVAYGIVHIELPDGEGRDHEPGEEFEERIRNHTKASVRRKPPPGRLSSFYDKLLLFTVVDLSVAFVIDSKCIRACRRQAILLYGHRRILAEIVLAQ